MILRTTTATHATHAPFALTAMRILATPMDTILTARATITKTTINPTQRPILVIIAATGPSFCTRKTEEKYAKIQTIYKQQT
uniref:Uncharacterized protein n=1 Tax=Romanomermis culicivorax TaxID=13658 RepID=A0A915HQ46_ROMCU